MSSCETIAVPNRIAMLERQPSFSAKTDGLAIAGLSLCFAIFLSIRPVGFYGTGYDDTRYAHAALNWLHAFPYLGTVHWDLRHPFNLLLAAAYFFFGVSQETIVGTCYVIDFALVIASYLCIRAVLGRPVALLASLLLISVPAIGAGGVSVEPLELLFSSVSFWTFFIAARTGRTGWLWISGLCMGLAWEVRETAIFLVLLYAVSFLFFPVVRRRDYVHLAVAACIPVAVEVAYYFALTGDLLYRFHVDANHIHVSSAHMVGRVSKQAQPLFNLKVQQSWLPSNDYLPGFWLTYPYQALFFDPFIGLVPLVSLAGFVLRPRSDWRGARSPLGMLALGAALCFIVAVYVLSLSPSARYYMFAVYAACVFAAVAIIRLWQSRHYVPTLILCTAILVGDLLGLGLANANAGAYAAVAYLRSHDGPFFVAPDDMRMLDIDLRAPSLSGKLTTNPTASRLQIAEYTASCPKLAVWCSQVSKSLLSRLLHTVGLDRHMSPRLFARLSSAETLAFVTPPRNSVESSGGK